MAENTVLEFRIDELSVQSAWLKTLYDLADELNCKCQTFFEEKYSALVYMAIRSYTNIGKMDSFLFISDYKEEWEMDREDLQHNQTCAYVYNCDAPDCSEIGCIGIMRTSAAGLLRIW